jgi:hypothetical protein
MTTAPPEISNPVPHLAPLLHPQKTWKPMNEPDDHTAHSMNGHDSRAETDASKQARRKSLNALADAVEQHHRTASLAYTRIRAALQDADKLLSLCDVGRPPDVEGDMSAYDRRQLQRWMQEADAAERRAPSKLKRLARSLRQLANRIEENTDAS